MTRIRMRIRVCQRNMKAQQDCKQDMEKATLWQRIKEKCDLEERTMSDFKTISYDLKKPYFAASEQQKARVSLRSQKSAFSVEIHARI